MKRLDSEFYKKLFALVLPIAFQNFMLAAVSASDAIMLGFLNQDFLSAVSLAGQIQFMHSLFLAALVIGTTMLVAQYCSVIMGHLGSDAVAANSIANIVKNLIVCVSLFQVCSF